MKLKPKEVINAILNNNTGRVAEMLEGFGLLKDGTAPYFTSANKRLVSTMLGAASVAAWHENLNEDLAHELIERTAMTVDSFSFLRLVVAGAEIENEDFDAIPENIRTALRRNDYTDQIARAIEDLDDNAFEAFLTYCITGEIETYHVRFNLPVIRRIYSVEVIPADLLFAFMASNLRETIDEHSGGLHGTLLGALDGCGLLGALGGCGLLGALGGCGLLGALLDGVHDGDDDDDDCPGCHSDD